MPSAEIVLAIAAILFAGFLLQSTVGFGSALIAMPLLSVLMGVKSATAIFGLVALVATLAITWVDRRHIDLRHSWRLIVASLLGVPLGLFLLRSAPEEIILKGLGVVLIAYSLFSLMNTSLRKQNERDFGWLAWPLGFVSGVLGGAYNTNGPPLVVFGALNRLPPQQFRATLQSVFFVTGVAVVLGQIASGLWTTQTMTQAALALPGLPVAIVLGRRLNARIPQTTFTQILHVLLIALGARLLLG